nr:NUDIX hydrolase [Microbacterium pseudoresistens]
MLAYDPARGVLLQHRVSWSHFGGTWALPGGARHEGESALDGALREAREEAGVAGGSVRPRLASLLELGYWSYTTVVADVVEPFEPVISDPESVALEWVPVDEVADRPLHPSFAEGWPALRALLSTRPAIVVDAANVVGSVPDGWWRDRAGAAGRLRSRLGRWVANGVADGGFVTRHDADSDAVAWFPEVHLVVEGAARGVDDEESVVEIVRAPGHGDDEIVAVVSRLIDAGRSVLAVTSDRDLRARVEGLGATTRSSGDLLARLDAVG